MDEIKINVIIAERNYRLTVNKADPEVKAPTAKKLTFNNKEQELVNAGSTKDGTLLYAMTTEKTAPTNDSSYSESIPKATNAGNYYVWYKVIGDDNHKDTKEQSVAVTIVSTPTTVKTGVHRSSIFDHFYFLWKN